MRLGYIFQSYNLIPQLTRPNIGLSFVRALMNFVRENPPSSRKGGTENRKTHRPYELSGGQQRVVIARALVNDPLQSSRTNHREPDTATGREIMQMLDDPNKEGKRSSWSYTTKISEHSESSENSRWRI